MLHLTRASTESFGGFYIAPVRPAQPAATPCWPVHLARALVPVVFVVMMVSGIAFVVDDAVAHGDTTTVALDA